MFANEKEQDLEPFLCFFTDKCVGSGRRLS